MGSEDGPGGVEATLTLADWRRRIATLYADVRRTAASDPAAALAEWRSVREELFRDHPQSPLPVEQRSGYRATHYPHDPALRFEVVVEPLGDAVVGAGGSAGGLGGFGGLGGLGGLSIDIPVSAGGTMSF